MMLVLNTNLTSCHAQTANNLTARKLEATMNRLSTGRRINSAADDAAGLNIASKMQSHIQGVNQAVRNMNDGIALLQTAEGGVKEIVNMMQRINELALQSATGSLSSDDRNAIDKEFQELKLEINRIADNTKYNEKKVLRGGIQEILNYADAIIDANVTLTDTPTSGAYTLYVSGVPVSVDFVKDETIAQRLSKVKDAINNYTDQHHATAAIEGDAIKLSSDNGEISAWFDSSIPGLSAASFGLQKSTQIVNHTISFDDIISNAPFIESTDTYIDFTDNGKMTETLWLNEDASISNIAPELSLVDGILYRGNDTGADIVGRVDQTLNGRNGQPLRLWRELGGYNNGDFNSGNPRDTIIEGWTTLNKRIRLDGTDTLDGFATPNDSTRAPDGGQEAANPGTGSYTTELAQNAVGDLSVHLVSGLSPVSNTPSGSGGVVHGPTIISNNSVALTAGDSVSFDWKAEGGGDAYDVYAYLLNVDTGDTEELLNQTGANASASTPWATITHEVTNPGNYKFVFVSGTWDATRGHWAGASLYIDNVTTTADAEPNNTLTASDIQELTSRVQYDDTDPTTATVVINGIEFSSSQGTDASDLTTDLASRIQAKIDDGTLGDIQINQNATTLQVFSNTAGKAIDVNISQTNMVTADVITTTQGEHVEEDVWGIVGGNSASTAYKLIEGDIYFTKGTYPLTLYFQCGPDGNQNIEYQIDNLYSDGAIFNGITGDLWDDSLQIDLLSVDHANDVIKSTEDALRNISDVQSKFGAYINRFTHAIDNLSTMSLNTSASRSRIMDADYALETAELAKLQILDQSSLAMLATSNSSKELILQLIQQNNPN